jgi:protein-disulfide isomerase
LILQDFRQSRSCPLSLTRRTLFTTGGVFALAAAGLAGAELPRLIDPAKADPAATTQAPATTPSPATGSDLVAELAKPGPDGDVVLGSPKALVTIIEYASMTCPHCAHFSQTTFPELKKRYIDTGKVRFIFREFPFDKLAAAAFMLARCAKQTGGSDKYMAVVETLFAKQNQWVVEKPLDPLQDVAKQFGFTADSFKACLTNGAVWLLGGARPRGREARCQFHADLLHQRQEDGGRHCHRRDGQGDRPLSQNGIRVFCSRTEDPRTLLAVALRASQCEVCKKTGFAVALSCGTIHSPADAAVSSTPPRGCDPAMIPLPPQQAENNQQIRLASPRPEGRDFP